MDILDRAGEEFAGHICEVAACGDDIGPNDAIAYDIDTHGDGTRVRVRHLKCHLAYQEGWLAGVTEGKHVAYLEASAIVRPYSPGATDTLLLRARQTFSAPGVAA